MKLLISVAIVLVLVIAGAGTFLLLNSSEEDQSIGGLVQVEMITSEGKIILELDASKAPVTVENFVSYVREGFYNGLIFHRVIDGFMIQGGGFDEEFERRPTRGSIQNESGNGLRNERMSIAMARLQDPDSATSQFYINLVDNPNLDQMGYAVFGRVTEGEEVVDSIASVTTVNRGPHQNVPAESIRIESMRVLGGL